MKIRLYATLSVLCHLAHFAGLLVGLILFFVNWKIAIAVLVASLMCIPLARFFDLKRFQSIFGPEIGREFTTLTWIAGDARKLALADMTLDTQKQRQVFDPNSQEAVDWLNELRELNGKPAINKDDSEEA